MIGFLRAARFVWLAIPLVVLSAAPNASKSENVFELMERVARLEAKPLWPGFDPASIPVAVYNGKNTYAFGFPSLPKGFQAVDGRPGVGVYKGVHPQVRANSRVMIDGVYAASCIAIPKAYLTGRDAAAIILHEKFHVFQALTHPRWLPNDAVLFSYPQDSAETVLARRLEIEAFRRAVASVDDETARAWAACGLEHHRRRIRSLAPPFVRYEKEVRRFEGLAEYVEWQILGVDPLEHVYELDDAPAAVRNWGYVAGRWIGTLLDRFDPRWKLKLESGESDDPQDLLEEAVREHAGLMDFSEPEIAALAAKTDSDFSVKTREKAKLRKRFDSRLGWRIVMAAEDKPLRLKFFLADHSEALNPGEMAHRLWLALDNESCTLEVIGQDCLTVSRSPAEIRRVVIPNLRNKPRVIRNRKQTIVSAAGILIRLEKASVSQRAETLLIRFRSS